MKFGPHSLTPDATDQEKRKRQTGTGRRNYCIRMWPIFAVFLYLCALELPPAAVLASAILYLGKNQLEIEYEF